MKLRSCKKCRYRGTWWTCIGGPPWLITCAMCSTTVRGRTLTDAKRKWQKLNAPKKPRAARRSER